MKLKFQLISTTIKLVKQMYFAGKNCEVFKDIQWKIMRNEVNN